MLGGDCIYTFLFFGIYNSLSHKFNPIRGWHHHSVFSFLQPVLQGTIHGLAVSPTEIQLRYDFKLQTPNGVQSSIAMGETHGTSDKHHPIPNDPERVELTPPNQNPL